MSLRAPTLQPHKLWRGFKSIGAYRADRLRWMLDLSREIGDIGQYQFGPWQGTMINSAELAHALLVEQPDAFVKPPSFVFLKTLVGNGLLTSEGAEWRRQRRLAAPAFQHRRIAAYADVMAQYAEQAQAAWRDGQELDIGREMMRLTLRVVGKTLFDSDVAQDAEAVGAALTAALHYIDTQSSKLLQIPPSWPTPANRRNRQTIERLDALIYRLIAERRASGADRGDLLSMLLQARDEGEPAGAAGDSGGMSDQQVRDEAMTIFLAGHETTAVGLTWAWYLLSQHPHIYARLRDEARQVLGGRAPTYEDLARLPYALQVFKEAIRLYPPAYVMVRYATRDVELNGHRIAKGTWVLLSPYALHRRSDYFRDPERFDPERFAPANEGQQPRRAYLPFGGGPRICIGNHFALMEGQILLAALAQRVQFDLSPDQAIAADPLITLRPRGAIRMRVARG